MVEQELERRIMDGIEALAIEGITVRGVWQTVDEGSLKDEETADITAVAAVAVGGRTFDAFSSCKVDFPVAVTLSVREDTDATGARFAAAYGAMCGLFQQWHFGTFDMDAFTAALAVDGFEPFALVGLNCGTPSRSSEGVWIINFNFTVRGTVRH